MKTKKKLFAENCSVSPSKSIFPCNLVLYSAGICRIYSCGLALFPLIIQRSNLNGGHLNPDEVTLNLDGEMPTLDGRTRPQRPPYNLSTDYNTCHFSMITLTEANTFHHTKSIKLLINTIADCSVAPPSNSSAAKL